MLSRHDYAQLRRFESSELSLYDDVSRNCEKGRSRGPLTRTARDDWQHANAVDVCQESYGTSGYPDVFPADFDDACLSRRRIVLNYATVPQSEPAQGQERLYERKLLTAKTHTDSAPSSVAEIKNNALLDRVENG